MKRISFLILAFLLVASMACAQINGGPITSASVQPASTTVAGKIETATNTEAAAASSTSVALVPGNTYGTFTGATIADNTTIPSALQALETAVELRAPSDIYEYYEISVEAGIDGAVAPDVAEVLSSTNKAVIRQFSGAANQDVFLSFEAPPDLKTGATGLYFRVIGFISNATAPAENETIIFNLTGASIANSELLSSALGAAVASTYTAPATLVQYDRVATPWSSLVTVTGLAAGETIMLNLLRDTTDTYAQKFGVAKVQIKILRTPSGS